MVKMGLIGFPLGHSFSKKYYDLKFEKEEINNVQYNLYPIDQITQFPSLYENDESVIGFNVTIPYKQDVIPYLNDLSIEARDIHAVNCITVKKINGKVILKGHNTDAYGFYESIKPLLQEHHTKALVLGNGGAAKAVIYSLKRLGITYKIISRSKKNGDLTYTEITPEIIKEHKIIINCSPVGTYPKIDESPEIPYEGISSKHLLYDLVYNPEQTQFLRKGSEKGAITKNGYEMLVLQAEKNWEIWNDIEK